MAKAKQVHTRIRTTGGKRTSKMPVIRKAKPKKVRHA